MLALYARELPAPKRPIVSVSVNLPDGILIRALNDHSFKQELLAVPAAVGTGLLAAMAVPAFQKVRASSQDKAVMSNLRQLGMGAEMYYLETGKDTATYDQIVGPQKEKMVKSITPVAGEDYTKLRFKMGEPIKITLPDGRVIQLDP
jgi:hypothetical protein